MTPRIGSLFSGYGGLDIAVQEVFGGEIAWHCEYEAAPSAILEHHWPVVPNLNDVTQVDWDTVPPIDILTGGYPCQPFSAAGKRKGTNDERHLWPYVRDAIRVLRPRYTVLENVAGHRTLGFDRVLGDLAEDGMHVRWTSLRASDIGAPHHRERLFILVTPADTKGPRRDHGEASNVRASDREVHAPGDDRDCTADSADDGLKQFDDCSVSYATRGRRIRVVAGGDRGEGAAEPKGIGCDGWRPAPGQAAGPHTAVGGCSTGIDWGAYAPAVRRWERLTRPAPAPTEPNKNNRPRLSAPFAEWMMGLPDGWVTDPAIGISRGDQLKAVGNGVCPQQAVAAIRILLNTNHTPA
ncbi:DNA (cytosine-5-)-methyltransferase [Prescottella agglutinans]|uniref:Cytosine-specific methyltransferase n=1 Tax=Prescottella agglutinans TaxID=1644129 RepID=A0ABT6MFQ2_9NOCA|nr:DNA (cytosine-5-)-methyltransferase [Prescottella agglutinans]MDH6283136.1 DNA (cytosine-5)-methyltransferase 1 [Prescottella agglutinans]